MSHPYCNVFLRLAVFAAVFSLPVLGNASANGAEEDRVPDIALGAEVNERISERMALLDSLHEISSRYQLTQLDGFNGLASGGVNLFNNVASIAVWPALHLGGDLPVFVGGGGAESILVVGNPGLNVKGRVYSNLQREFPHFIYLNGWVQFPRRGSQTVLVNRTDLGISAEIKKIFYRFILNSDLGFVSRIDSKNSSRRYGDEIFIGIGGEYYFPTIPFALETSLTWRNAWSATIDGADLPRQSIMTSSNNIKYQPWVGVWFEGGVDIPLKSGDLGEVAALFGDYAASGLWGTTLWFNVRYQF